MNEINGINLDNYFPCQRTCDTVLYVHKDVLKKEEEEKAKRAKAKKKVKINHQTNTNEFNRNESVMEQTVRFAKHLAPIILPPNEGGNTPIFYTVETCSKCKRKDKKKEVQNKNDDDATYKKKKCKEIIESYRNERTHNRQHSTTESVTQTSQSNTLDDLNNPSLNCTISEQSNKRAKYNKNELNSKRKRNKDKFVISESFEAVATEYAEADDTRIKVQLMNNAEKNAFCDSIKSPVLNAIREYISEFSNTEVKEEVKIVQRTVKNNADKLDKILDRLAYIEKHLQNTEHTKVRKSPRQCIKASTLEQLGEDIDDDKSLDEEFEVKRSKSKYEDNRVDNLGCGEVVSMRPSSSVGVKTERTNRIPARYCWTDANKELL